MPTNFVHLEGIKTSNEGFKMVNNSKNVNENDERIKQILSLAGLDEKVLEDPEQREEIYAFVDENDVLHEMEEMAVAAKESKPEKKNKPIATSSQPNRNDNWMSDTPIDKRRSLMPGNVQPKVPDPTRMSMQPSRSDSRYKRPLPIPEREPASLYRPPPPIPPKESTRVKVGESLIPEKSLVKENEIEQKAMSRRLPPAITRLPTIPDKKPWSAADLSTSLVGKNEGTRDSSSLKQQTLEELEKVIPPIPSREAPGKPLASHPVKKSPLSRLSLNPTRLAPTRPEVPIRRRSPSAPTIAKQPDADPDPVLPESVPDDDDPVSSLNPSCSSSCCRSHSVALSSSPNEESTLNHEVEHIITAMGIPPPLSMQELTPPGPPPPPVTTVGLPPPPPPSFATTALSIFDQKTKTTTKTKMFGKDNLLEEIRNKGGVNGAGLKRTESTKPVSGLKESGTLSSVLEKALITIQNANRISDQSDNEDQGWESTDSW